jgi:hypothetical protein
MNTQLLFQLQISSRDPNTEFWFIGIALLSALIGAVITYLVLRKKKEPEVPSHENKGTVSQLVEYNKECKEYFQKL